MRITLDIQDRNLTPKPREELIGLLHRIEAEPERYACDPEPPTNEADVVKMLAAARERRQNLPPISPTEFFAEILKTEGFPDKAAAHRHVQELRDEWK